MKILKRGVPLVLNGECGGCHTEIETDTAEASKYPVPTRGGIKFAYSAKCPVCGSTINVGHQQLEKRVPRRA